MNGIKDWEETNNNVVSPDVVEAQAASLRRETEATISLLKALQTNASAHYHNSLTLQSRLAQEEEKAKEAVKEAEEARGHVISLQTKSAQLEKEVNEMGWKVKEAEKTLSSSLAGKEGRIGELEKEVKAREELMAGLKALRGNVDSFRIGEGLLKEPCGALVLPDGCVVVADTHEGILKFSPNTQLLCRSRSADWKWPQGLAYDERRKVLIVSLAKRIGEDAEKFERAIAEVDPERLEMISSMPGPPQAAFDHASREKLALGRAGELYLTLADDHGSSLYKYAGGQWYLVTGRPNAYFADVGVLASTGPMTEVLVVETKMGYIHKLTLRGWDVADRRSIAAVEKPGAIAVDSDGRLFCQDIISGKLREIDTRRWDAKRDIAVVDEPLFAVSAASGYLAAAGRDSKSVRVFRYSQDAVKLDDLGLGE